MSGIFCGNLTQQTAVSGTVTGFGAPVDLSKLDSVFWNNVDTLGAQIQIWTQGKVTRLPFHLVLFNYAAKTGWGRIWVPQFTTLTTVVLDVYLEPTQTQYVPTVTSLTLTNNGTVNNVTGWTNDTGTIGARTTNPAPPYGTGYLYGGTTTPCLAHQDIDVSSYATNIDAGLYLYRQRWYQAGFGSDSDQGELQVAFLDNGGSSIVGTVGAGPLSIPDQVFRLRTQIRYVPPNTRKIRVYYHAIRFSGTNNDAYISNIQPALISVDPYGPVKVYQSWDGVDCESVGIQGYTGGQDSTGKQQGKIEFDMDCWSKSATSGDTNSGAGICYDQTTYWYGTDNTSPALRKYSAIGASPTVVATNSSIGTDASITSPTAMGQPAYYGSQIYAGVENATNGYVTLWDTSLAFVSKFTTTTQTAKVTAIAIIPPNQPGWTTTDPRLFVASSSDSTQLFEYTTAGSYVGSFPLLYTVSTIRGLVFNNGFLWINSSANDETGMVWPDGLTSIGLGSAGRAPVFGGVLDGHPAGETMMGLGSGPNNTLYWATDNASTENVQTWAPRSDTLTGGGGAALANGSIEYTGLLSTTTWALFCTGNLTTGGSNEMLACYKEELTASTRAGIMYHTATGKVSMWDTTNGFQDSGLTMSSGTSYRLCLVYNGTTSRTIYYSGGNATTQNTITAFGSTSNDVSVGRSASATEPFNGTGGYSILYPGVPSAAMVKLDYDSLDPNFWFFTAPVLNVTTTATIGPTGSVSLGLVDGLTTTATIGPTGAVALSLIEGLTTTATIVPTGSVALSLIDGVTSDQTIVPTGSITFGVFGEITVQSEATISPESSYTFFQVGSNPGPLPYAVRVQAIDQTTRVEQPTLEVAVGPQVHTVRRLVRNITDG